MNENDENVDPMCNAAPDVEHLRLEISENGEVFYLIDKVTKVPTTSCFSVSKNCGEKLKEKFFVFSKRVSSKRLCFWFSLPFVCNL